MLAVGINNQFVRLNRGVILLSNMMATLNKYGTSFWDKVEVDPARSITCLAALLGIVILIIGPAYKYIPDESAHFQRAYQISEFHFIAPHRAGEGYGDYLPKSLSYLRSPLHQPLNPQDTTWVRFDASSVYTPIPYLIDAIGIFLARSLELSPTIILYVGRLCSLVTWLVLLYTALRLAGKWVWAFGAFALLPMCIFQSVHITADVATVGLAMVFVALLLRALTSSRKFNDKELKYFVLVTLLLSLTKQPFFLFSLAALAIPAKRFTSSQYRWRSLAIITLPGILLAAGWSLLMHGANVTNGVLTADPHKQLLFILHHPLTYGHVILATHIPNNSYLLIESLTTPASWLGLHTILWSVMVSYALLAFGVLELSDKRLVTLVKQQRLILIAVAVITFLVIDTTLYLYFSTVGAKIITGLQGRYYLPILILLALVIKNKTTFIQVSKRSVGKFILLGSLVPYAVFCVLLAHGYPLHAIRYKLLLNG
jgi:uncharacterized membrane protein